MSWYTVVHLHQFVSIFLLQWDLICIFGRVYSVACSWQLLRQRWSIPDVCLAGRAPLIVSNLSRKSISRSFTERGCSSLFKHHTYHSQACTLRRYDYISHWKCKSSDRKNVLYFSHPRTLHNIGMAFLQQWTLNEVDTGRIWSRIHLEMDIQGATTLVP